jgi:AcrR family transcriptional regulator
MTTVSPDRPAELEHELGLRERKKQQTRLAIHEATFRLIEQQGLDATTIDQICAAAEVSSRTFFNYFPSKAAALLQLPAAAITDQARDRFRAADGGLVWALCDVVGGATEFAPDHARMKKLIGTHPELITTVSTMMLELRSQYVALAAERAATQEDAELAVALVMAAMGRSMHEQNDAASPLVERLRQTVRDFGRISDEPLSAR